jgi:glycosyltransferase involved in cell wall biosynthesis
MSKPTTMIFQLGTNNWQRPKKDGSGELEFAPGSGVLHEAHHNAYNLLPGVKSYSMYPSKNQGQPTEAHADYRVFELDHDIPICESASPNSSKRWHSMDDTEFNAYVKRLENEVYDFMKACEAKAGTTFTCCIAHHSFINPLVLKRVINRRVAEDLPRCPLFCFVHGTALKMYRWELGPKETEEQKSFPMRFHKMILEEKLFDDQHAGIAACFVISDEQKGGIKELFPMFPQDLVIVAPNGINVEKFKPRGKSLAEVIVEQTRTMVWPASPSEEDCKKYKQMIVFVGKYAEWKRQAALLYAMEGLEKEFPDLVCLCVGTGPEPEIEKEKKRAEGLGLKNTFLLGARGQDILAELYTVAQLGCFPSFKEPFGLVFVECMACKTPVIGANSGGPKDFVDTAVGELVAEPPETTDLSTVDKGVKTLGKTLQEAITRALKEDWKTKKGEACFKLAHDKFTVATQVTNMLKDVERHLGASFKPPTRVTGDTCEWMFGDAATGIMGFQALASLNPLRWSGAVSFEKGIQDMEEVLKHGTRPLILKVPAGVSSKERKFANPEEVIAFLKANDPKKRSLQEAVDHADKWVAEREGILAEATANEKEAKEKFDKALAASGKAQSSVCEWMYGDAAAGMGGLFKMCARYNPTRWSGAQTFQKTIQDLDELRKHQAELKENPRPILIRIPPGSSGKQEELKDTEAAIERLNKECGGEGETALNTLQQNHIDTEAILKDAHEQLEVAKKSYEEAKTKLAAS